MHVQASISGDAAIADAARAEGFEPYRAVSKAAVLSLALSLMGLVGLVFPIALFLALLGAIFGVVGSRNLRLYPQELTGKPIAILGAALGVLLVVGGTAMHSVIYATEVPEGYRRITFADLQPTKDRPDLPVPAGALEMDGGRIFVKGYVYPDGQQYDIKRFILVPDMGTCCFGGQPKLTDMIEVTLNDPLRIEYSRRKRKLAGILNVDTSIKPVAELGGVYYQLSADHLQ